MAIRRDPLAGCLSSNPSTKEYFSRVYAESDDPWNFESSEYESQKYEQSFRALARETYENALEIGCSIGVFTAKLARICKRLHAIDVAEAAVQKARQRCGAFGHVHFSVMCLPETYPNDLFDLTVLSEVGYYLTPQELAKLADEITDHSVADGHLLLVHWLARVPGRELRGDDVHDHFLTRSEWSLLSSGRESLFRIDVLQRKGGLADPL
jgi:SAM-dependent methyltransferase